MAAELSYEDEQLQVIIMNEIMKHKEESLKTLKTFQDSEYETGLREDMIRETAMKETAMRETAMREIIVEEVSLEEMRRVRLLRFSK
tara:strand:- start:1124 stop:1384 length:261 start_codon:yes stop_codon:yes gene_type:complete